MSIKTQLWTVTQRADNCQLLLSAQLTWLSLIANIAIMKVKIAELKNHLSKYVQSVREGGEPVEVCVRETTVAYLVGAEQSEENGHVLNPHLAERLRAKGLRVISHGRTKGKTPPPGEAGDGRSCDNTVVALRAGRDW